MRKVFCLLLIGAVVLCTTVPVRAADELSDERVEQVRRNCKLAQSVMQRLQSTDVATRISRGRVYENLLSRVVTPFNSRVAANNYNAAGLTAITGTMNQTFTDFKADYSTYEDSFSDLVSMDCERDPRGFYTLLVTTRENRDRIAVDIVNMNTLLGQYSSSFSDLQSSVEGGPR